MRHDTQIIESFLLGHNAAFGTTQSLREIPDAGGRKRGIDGLSYDDSGKSWAIEHTLLEPFWGEREDTIAFLQVFAPLEKDSSLTVPGYEFHLFPRVGAIPKGVSRSFVRNVFRSWLLENLHNFQEGTDTYDVPGLPFELAISIDKSPSPRSRLFVGRTGVPDTRPRVVRKALSRKLSKLMVTPADERILIFEKTDSYTGYVGITTAVDALATDFPQLKTLDHIWVAQSSFAETDNTVFFLRVWPDGVTAKFKSAWQVAGYSSSGHGFSRADNVRKGERL